MAYANDTSTTLGALSFVRRLTQLRASLRGRISKHLAYRATRAELSSLSDHELKDIGLHRGLIDDLAAQVADKA